MVKSRINVSIDPEVLERFDRAIAPQTRSEALENLMRKQADMEKHQDPELVERRNELRDRIEKKKAEENSVVSERESLEAELHAVEATLEEREEQEQHLENALPPLTDKFHELRRSKSNASEALRHLKTTEMFHAWLERMELSGDELVEELTDSLEAEIEV